MPSKSTDAIDAALWGAVLIFAIVVLALAVWLLKRRLFSTPDRTEQFDVLSLQQLRKMLADGQITNDEFERLKTTAIGEAQRPAIGKSGGARSAPRGEGGAKGVK
ncbi:MAG TPA: hypothetical protein VJZ71_02105 [Phycisphaerae bacterium]|nr:hypothetical protein [Phycisphaerae bacterium]